MTRKCVICGEDFEANTCANTCSDICKGRRQKETQDQYYQDNRERVRVYQEGYRERVAKKGCEFWENRTKARRVV